MGPRLRPRKEGRVKLPRLGPLMKVDTRTGDDGSTGLLYGTRVGTDSAGPSAYGDSTGDTELLARADHPLRV